MKQEHAKTYIYLIKIKVYLEVNGQFQNRVVCKYTLTMAVATAGVLQSLLIASPRPFGTPCLESLYQLRSILPGSQQDTGPIEGRYSRAQNIHPICMYSHVHA